MRIVLTGGVTGGHIYPAIAIGDKFKEACPDCEIIYIAGGLALEKEIIPKAGYKLYEVKSSPLYRHDVKKLADTLSKTIKGRREAKRIMKEFKPDVVISTGSYISVPVVLAAKSLGASIYLHEQNGFPGISNKAMAKISKKVFLGFESAGAYFDDKSKLIYSGNPVRSEFAGRDKAADRDQMGINKDDFVIMVFGGSQGSETTNEIGKEISQKYAGVGGVTVIWGTGKRYFDEVSAGREKNDLNKENIRIMPYIEDMPMALSVSDISISRSGALSVAETTMAGRAAIFVPSPNVTEDHQYYNARAVYDAGGAFIVREDKEAKQVAAEILNMVEEMRIEPARICEMEEASKSMAPVNATEIIYETIMQTYSDIQRDSMGEVKYWKKLRNYRQS